MRTELGKCHRKWTLFCLLWIFCVLPCQAAEILLGDTTVCAGSTVQLEIVGDFATLSWSPAETLSCDNCPNPRATPSATTTYTATFEEDGVEQMLSITVTVPVVKPIDDLDICKNTEIEFDAGVPYEGFTYFWEPASLFSCLDCPNPSLVNDAAVAPIVIRYGLMNGTCTILDSFNLEVIDADGPVYEVIEDARFCLGDDINLGGDADPGTIYSWTSNPPGFISTDSNPNVSPTTSTTYYLQASKVGCTVISFDTVEAILTTPPALSLSVDTYDICQGDTIALAPGELVESDVDYRWEPRFDVVDSTVLNTNASPSSSTEYVVTASKGVCEVTDTVQVNVTPISITIAEGDSMFLCKGTTANLSVTGTPDPFTTTWSPEANLSSGVGQAVAVTRLTGAYTVYATITNGMCTLTDSIYIQIDSLPPNMEIMPQDTTICEGEFVILRSPAFEPMNYPNLIYTWGPPSGNFQTGDTLYNVVVTPTDTTDYVRTITNVACVDSNLVTVNVQPVESITVLPADTTICAGESFQYQIVNTDLEEFMWMPGAGLSCTDCPDPVATPNGPIEYMIEATDANGCPVMGMATVNVEPEPTLDFIGTGDICPGQTVILNATAIPMATYSWTSTDPDFPDTDNPTPVASPTTNASYTAVISTPFCADVSITIDINIIPPANLTVTQDPTICAGESIVLTADAGGVQGNFNWTSGATGPSIEVQPATQTDYRVTFSNPCQSLVATTTVSIEDDFNPGIIPNPANNVVNLGESIDLNLSAGISNDQIANIMWTENGSAIGGSSNTINVRPPIEGANEYTVKVTTVNGCMAEGLIVIFAVRPTVIIPNAFTPNNDGLNDELNVVRIIGNVEVTNMSIFDRWGNRVYDEADGGWDGTFNGKPMPSDVYVYLVEIAFPDGSREVKKGEVSLIR